MKAFRHVLRGHFIKEFENVYTYALRNSFLGWQPIYFNKFIYTYMGPVIKIQTISDAFILRCLDLL